MGSLFHKFHGERANPPTKSWPTKGKQRNKSIQKKGKQQIERQSRASKGQTLRAHDVFVQGVIMKFLWPQVDVLSYPGMFHDKIIYKESEAS